MRRPIWFGRQRLIVEMEDPPPPDLGLFGEELVCGEDGLSLSYPVGILKESEASPDSFEIAIVARDPVRGFLVCLPKLAWDRKANKRKLPAQSLIKPLHIVLAACGEDSDRLTASEGCQCSVWIAWLKPELVGSISFPGDSSANHLFVDQETEEKCFPFAEALLAVAREKFGILPSEEPGVGPDERLAALEEKFSFLQGGLEELLALHKEGSGYVTAKEDLPATYRPKAKPAPAPTAAAKTKAKSVGRQGAVVPPPPGLVQAQFPGLDPGAVNSAIQAGVPVDQLVALSRLMGNAPGGLTDTPLTAQNAARSDVETLDEALGEEGDAGEVGEEVTMTKVLSKLTDIVSHLSNSKKKPDSLEEVLEFSGGASGSADNVSGSGRKHAAVIRTLKRLFKEDPKQLWKSIESNMAEEFNLQTGLPNAPHIPFTARGWAEHRSKIQGYARTVRSTWAVSGILDALRGGAIDEARCRCCLYLAQMEQESLDHGSFLLAQEFSLEPPAPMSQFALHQLPDATEMAYTRLLDQRWVEAFANRLKEVDNYVEMRRKLGQRQKYDQPPPNINLKKGGKGEKGKGRGKDQKADQATE